MGQWRHKPTAALRHLGLGGLAMLLTVCIITLGRSVLLALSGPLYFVDPPEHGLQRDCNRPNVTVVNAVQDRLEVKKKKKKNT
jgi:hypothetical protein